MKYFLVAIFIGFVFMSSCTDITEHVDDDSIDPINNPSVFDTTDYKIVFTSDRNSVIKKQVYVMNKDGSNQTRLTDDDGDYYFPQVSPNGRQIIFHSHTRDDNDEIYSVNYDGTNFQNLSNTPGDDVMPMFSPDGSKIVFASTRDGNSEIYIMNSDGTNQTRLTDNPLEDHSPQFNAGGTSILYYSVNLDNYKYYINLMNPDGTNNVCLTTGHVYHINIYYDDWASMMAHDATPRYSPDGSKIVFMSFNFNTVNYEIHMMDSDGQNHQLLCNTEGYNISPIFSPDGSKIIFRSHRYANYDIFEMNLNGGGQVDLLNDEGHAYMPCFSPDGEKLLYSTDRLGYYHIWIMDNNGMNQTQLTEGNYNDYCAQFFQLR